LTPDLNQVSANIDGYGEYDTEHAADMNGENYEQRYKRSREQATKTEEVLNHHDLALVQALVPARTIDLKPWSPKKKSKPSK
jgi:hypothetical protein